MRLLSVGEAALELRLSENTVYGLCRARKIRHERHGLGRGKILIPEDAIVEYRRGVTVAAEGLLPQPPPAKPRSKAGDFKHLRV